MCEICEGKRVVHQVGNAVVECIPCPNCHISQAEWEEKMNYIAWRIEQAEKLFVREREQIAV